MADQENKTGAQSGAPSTSPQGGPKLVKHIVTESDIKHNPDLEKRGVKVGDEVEIPEDAKAKADERAQKDAAAAKAKAEKDAAKSGKKKYTVISPFADKDNFSKKWEEGDDVSHFSQDRLDLCVERGLVKKV
ncbi:hypothetical protein K7A41_23500 [Sphingobacterium sp. InxBP1]|uniref:hypothetical protein n=1 Tax=Sphingobacterium sp. InxBP1 TaxID=2870328 RepID=UPI0022435B4B|nr:hypothetical protein [Sphingobacterium sp. InxBP1]MCW8314211.1 hypothetical protein [Sphingobacterium sp. InxBP1]